MERKAQGMSGSDWGGRVELQENVRCWEWVGAQRRRRERLSEKIHCNHKFQRLEGWGLAGGGKKVEERGCSWVYTCPTLGQQAPTDLQRGNGWRLQSLETEIIKELLTEQT